MLRSRLSASRGRLIQFLKYILSRFGIGITSYSRLVSLQIRAQDQSRRDLEFIRSFNPSNYQLLLSFLEKSTSQLRQDLFVLAESDFKHGGYFVEFGATDGKSLSNSYLLESEFAWTGILAEPAKVWQQKLKTNRPNSIIENKCVWKDSDSTLTFNETNEPELSTIASFSQKDGHVQSRKSGLIYEVQTISLRDLLRAHQAPKTIDYLSLDTEGSEYEILKAFNFNEYNVRIITVEHNFTHQREKIFNLLTSYGYTRKYENVSEFDDWYIKS